MGAFASTELLGKVFSRICLFHKFACSIDWSRMGFVAIGGYDMRRLVIVLGIDLEDCKLRM